jgi:hypothetical protein
VISFDKFNPKVGKPVGVPLVGNIMASRWAFEALAVTSFTDNLYERNFFELDKQKYENQFYNVGFLYELQSQLETMKDEEKQGKEVKPQHMEVIHTNLPVITAYCEMQPYQGDYSYSSLKQYMKEAETILSTRGNKATLKVDALMASMLRKYGKEEILKLKKDNYNIQLEDFVIGAAEKRMLDVVDDVIVPRSGLVFLTPQSKVGRAPFYSSEKILGSWHIKTLWFNMAVMLLMCLVIAGFLFADYPGKLLRKSEQ